MSDPGMADGVFFALVLLLPLSALLARRLPMASVVRMALAWLAIFSVLLAAVLGYQRFK